jgi:glycosyltransferase involved in cell wall biosynthesis
MSNKIKIVRVTTVPISLEKLLGGQMKFMVGHGFNVTMVSSDFDNKEELSKIELSPFIVVNMTRNITPVSDLISLLNLVIVLYKIRPSIVHTHTPKAGFLGMLAAWLTGVPIRLHTVAGLPLMETSGLKKKVLEAVERFTYLFATKVYPNSTSLKEIILKHEYANFKKLKVIGQGSSNGIDTTFFNRSAVIDQQADAIALINNITPGEFIFIFIGRLVRDKGIEELVNAFKRFCGKHSNSKLLLVGPREDSLDPLNEACIKEIRSNGSIIEFGYKTDVRPYLALSHVLVFPSYREGFPNVPMQAGCFNLPSIVTNINGCNEIIMEGVNGMIIPVKDSCALFEAMEEIYLNTSLYNKLAGNARKLIVDRFEQAVIWDLILEEYKGHLKEKEIVY